MPRAVVLEKGNPLHTLADDAFSAHLLYSLCLWQMVGIVAGHTQLHTTHFSNQTERELCSMADMWTL